MITFCSLCAQNPCLPSYSVCMCVCAQYTEAHFDPLLLPGPFSAVSNCLSVVPPFNFSLSSGDRFRFFSFLTRRKNGRQGKKYPGYPSVTRQMSSATAGMREQRKTKVLSLTHTLTSGNLTKKKIRKRRRKNLHMPSCLFTS